MLTASAADRPADDDVLEVKNIREFLSPRWEGAGGSTGAVQRHHCMARVHGVAPCTRNTAMHSTQHTAHTHHATRSHPPTWFALLTGRACRDSPFVADDNMGGGFVGDMDKIRLHTVEFETSESSGAFCANGLETQVGAGSGWVAAHGEWSPSRTDSAGAFCGDSLVTQVGSRTRACARPRSHVLTAWRVAVRCVRAALAHAG
jgi:hypothetical protein